MPKRSNSTELSQSRKKVRCHKGDALSIGSAPVSVLVGPEGDTKTFYIHADLLTQHSEFFTAAMTGRWQESQDKFVRLPEERADAFEVFAQYVYSGKVYTKPDGPRGADGEMLTNEWNEENTLLLECWLLVDKLLSTSFKDAAMDAFLHFIHDEGSYLTSLHKIVYTWTAGPNALRKLAIDLAVRFWDDERLAATAAESDLVEFFRDLAIAQRKVTGEQLLQLNEVPFEREGCGYHEHVADGKPCYRTKFG